MQYRAVQNSDVLYSAVQSDLCSAMRYSAMQQCSAVCTCCRESMASLSLALNWPSVMRRRSGRGEGEEGMGKRMRKIGG